MKTGKEILSATRNIKFYASNIKALGRQQFDEDYETGNITGISLDPASQRFECLAAIIANAEKLETYCQGIEANVKGAELSDKEWNRPKEEKEEEDEPF